MKHTYTAGEYDVVVIGAGHAGIEAALAAARLGHKTAIFTINLDAIGNMPCNPSIGGTAKGHLVREIDALGGQMGKSADATFLQSRMLNRGKGPAVHSLRVQSDRRRYQEYMKNVLESEKNLDIIQAEVVKINCTGKTGNKKIKSVVTHYGCVYNCKAVIICTGTYLKGRVIVGETAYSSGPDGMFAATKLSASLVKHGIELMRFKTGTPARINSLTIDYSKMEVQEGDEKIVPFSFENEALGNTGENKVVCHLTYTNETTHQIIRDNLHRSPLYAGMIEGIGPRYCPSIEDKIVRFSNKERHQLFIEPMGLHTKEMYVQGMSSSLPVDVQEKMIHSVAGLEHAQIMRNAYAIEYDCIDPTQLYPTLEFKTISGLFGAGQFNGTSGYEEAAAQGLIAGINAAMKLEEREQLILDRSTSYIGTLIDDLVTKGTNEPYRMMTSRSEYRLLLRQDNADVRLTPVGKEIGLVGDAQYERFLDKKSQVEKEIERMRGITVPPSEKINEIIEKAGGTPITTGVKMSDLIKRPEITYELLKDVDPTRSELRADIAEEAQIFLKYEGYIAKQTQKVEQFKKMEQKKLPDNINYEEIKGLRIEAMQKLNKIKPQNLGQASRISGVSPADISVLIIALSL